MGLGAFYNRQHTYAAASHVSLTGTVDMEDAIDYGGCVLYVEAAAQSGVPGRLHPIVWPQVMDVENPQAIDGGCNER
jgi:hypothetical protein